jgi:hypothetical protein
VINALVDTPDKDSFLLMMLVLATRIEIKPSLKLLFISTLTGFLQDGFRGGCANSRDT